MTSVLQETLISRIEDGCSPEKEYDKKVIMFAVESKCDNFALHTFFYVSVYL